MDEKAIEEVKEVTRDRVLCNQTLLLTSSDEHDQLNLKQFLIDKINETSERRGHTKVVFGLTKTQINTLCKQCDLKIISTQRTTEATRREAAKKAKAQQQEKDRVEREKKKQDAHDKINESLKSQIAGLTKDKGQFLDEIVHLKEDNNRLRQILIDNGIEYPERGATSSSSAQGGGSGALSERDVANRAGQNRSPG